MFQVESVSRDTLRVRGGSAEAQRGEKERFPRDSGTANRSQELRSPEGQAFLRHCQVRLTLTQGL